MDENDKLSPVDQTIEVSDGHSSFNWRVADEVPVAFVYNRRNYAVMLATPADLEDYAIGFSRTERIITQQDQILDLVIHTSSKGVELHFTISSERLERFDLMQRRRNLVGRVGCGLCGLENAETFFEKLPPVSDSPIEIAKSALDRALGELDSHQPLNELTKSVHGAAFALPNGEIVIAREDVGRHNALDKLLGACVRKEIDVTDGFVLMSSRCSYEIIEKAVRLGVCAVASLSGPTAFAIRKAKEANMRLYCRSGNSFVDVTL